jgi:hypothetical protein
MEFERGYPKAVRCLGQYGYGVAPDGQGYIISSRSDPLDVSLARKLDDLADLAELVEWRALHEVQHT